MTSSGESPEPEIATDLVEYLVLVVPGPDALAEVGPGLRRIVESAAVRILDLVVVSVDERGMPEVLANGAVRGLEAIRDLTVSHGVLLSQHDIELVTLALQPGDVALVVVAEDRWAEPLAAAARALGGEVRAGERIARDRVQAALDRAREQPKEA